MQAGWAAAAENPPMPPAAKCVSEEAPAGEMKQVPQDISQAKDKKSE
jgi:hypothetical protein